MRISDWSSDVCSSDLRKKTAALMVATALFGAMFVGMQAFEWTKLIEEGVRPWGNPMGAPQFGASFFMITGFHGFHVTCGVIMLLIIAHKVFRGDYDRSGDYSAVEIGGLYWHFVDLVWVFIFSFFYLWCGFWVWATNRLRFMKPKPPIQAGTNIPTAIY